jgi:hypothetical protein
MKGSTIAGVLVLGGMIAGAVLLSNGELVNVKPRAARIPCEKATKENCPAGIFEQKDFCLCLTVAKEGELADEETIVPVAKRVRMEVCELVDGQSGQKYLATRYPLSATPLDKACKLVLDDIKFPAVSFHNVPTGIETRLEEVCAPCRIGPDSWNHCPECFHRGDCDKVCPEPEEIE